MVMMAVLSDRIVVAFHCRHLLDGHDLADLGLELLQLLLLYPNVLLCVLQVALQNRVLLYIVP